MRAFQTARQERSALRLQCCYRQRMARKRVRLQKENSIASMIQLRMRLWHHFRWMRRSKQILPLQCAVRCFMSRRRLLRKRREIIERESLILDYDRFAAHLISAVSQGLHVLDVFRPSFYPSIHPPTHPPTHAPIHPPTHPPTHAPIHPSTHPSIHPSTHAPPHTHTRRESSRAHGKFTHDVYLLMFYDSCMMFMN
jgi:hypothetical protein